MRSNIWYKAPPSSIIQHLIVKQNDSLANGRMPVNGRLVQILADKDDMILTRVAILTDYVVDFPIPGSVLKHIRFDLEAIEEGSYHVRGSPGMYIFVFEPRENKY